MRKAGRTVSLQNCTIVHFPIRRPAHGSQWDRNGTLSAYLLPFPCILSHQPTVLPERGPGGVADRSVGHLGGALKSCEATGSAGTCPRYRIIRSTLATVPTHPLAVVLVFGVVILTVPSHGLIRWTATNLSTYIGTYLALEVLSI